MQIRFFALLITCSLAWQTSYAALFVDGTQQSRTSKTMRYTRSIDSTLEDAYQAGVANPDDLSYKGNSVQVTLSQKSFWDNDVQGYVLLLKDDLSSASPLASLDYIEQEYCPELLDILKKHDFTGKAGQTFILDGVRDGQLVHFVFVGVGKQDGAWDRECEMVRRAVGAAVQALKKITISSAVVALPDAEPLNLDEIELLEQMSTIVYMADYKFTSFKTEQKTAENWTLAVVVDADVDATDYQESLDRSGIMATMINNARHWEDTPPNIMTPKKLAQEARRVAHSYGLECTVFGRDRAQELGMGGFMAVDAGSAQEGQFVVLEYRTDAPDAPTIALCGKGVTFDTGGVSLKSSSNMDGMKYDMCGAASVIATLGIIAQLKPEVNVIGITPLVENMPDGRSARQDDVIFAMNGKSIEIKNTDAEGRLILADALCYAEQFYNPDIIIDVATLTGACLAALGHFYTGLMTKDQELSVTLQALGKQTGDLVWPLPLSTDYTAANKSEVADVSNLGSSAYGAGSITAGAFLSNFVSKARWAHLDIAGTSCNVPDINYVGKGATGASIRLLTSFIMSYAQV